MKKSILQEKSLAFAIMISKFIRELKSKRLYEIASQLFRSGTSIGANSMEAQGAQSKRDFAHKLEIALKEGYETMYRLNVLEKGFDFKVDIYQNKCVELIKLLVSSIKTIKSKI